MVKYNYTHTFEASNQDEANDICQALFDKNAVAVPAEEVSGESLDLYLILAWDSDSFELTVADTWTEGEVEENPEGWKEACQKAKTSHSEVRVVILPAKGLVEVFQTPWVGGGTAKNITEEA